MKDVLLCNTVLRSYGNVVFVYFLKASALQARHGSGNSIVTINRSKRSHTVIIHCQITRNMTENETTFMEPSSLSSVELKIRKRERREETHRDSKVNDRDKKLRKELSLIHGVGLIVGTIIGSGIFISPNGVLQEAGSYGMALVMWVIGGLLATGGGLCLCELGNFVKKSGCEYAYIKEGFSFNNRNCYVTILGDVLSFLFTWTSIFCIRPMSIAIQMITFGTYVVKPFFLECDVPEEIIKMTSVTAIGKFICSV